MDSKYSIIKALLCLSFLHFYLSFAQLSAYQLCIFPHIIKKQLTIIEVGKSHLDWAMSLIF